MEDKITSGYLQFLLEGLFWFGSKRYAGSSYQVRGGAISKEDFFGLVLETLQKIRGQENVSLNSYKDPNNPSGYDTEKIRETLQSLSSEDLSQTIPDELKELVEKEAQKGPEGRSQPEIVRDWINQEKKKFPKTAEETSPSETRGNFFQRTTARVISSPARALVNTSEEESVEAANAQSLIFNYGVTSAGAESFFKEKSQELGLGVSDQQIQKIIVTIQNEEAKFSRAVLTQNLQSFRIPGSGLSLQQISGLLTSPPQPIGPSNNFLTRIGKGLFGKLSKKVLDKAGEKAAKKLATKVATGTATGALATLLAPLGPIGTVVAKGLTFAGKKILGYVGTVLRTLKDRPEAVFAGSLTVVLVGVVLASNVLVLIGSTGVFSSLVLAGASSTGVARAGLGTFFQTLVAIVTSTYLRPFMTAVFVGIGVSAFTLAIYIFIINSGAYLVPPSASLTPGLIESPYIGVTKTAEPDRDFDNNELPLTVQYTVEIIAKKGTLSNIGIAYKCSVTKKDSSPPCPEPQPITSGGEAIPSLPSTATISPTESFTFTYRQEYTAPTFEDTFVTDTITVTADAVEQKGAVAAGSVRIKIGEPPEECPAGWPIEGYYLTQGAYTQFTHSNAEAIDVGTNQQVGLPIRATHAGVARVVKNDNNPYGIHVEILSTCDGKDFFSRYAHLKDYSVTPGEQVEAGEIIGINGNTGNSKAPHLHYEFRYQSGGPTGGSGSSYVNNAPFMMNIGGQSYVPKDLKRHCSGRTSCNTSIP